MIMLQFVSNMKYIVLEMLRYSRALKKKNQNTHTMSNIIMIS